jgi:hypothetical protein
LDVRRNLIGVEAASCSGNTASGLFRTACGADGRNLGGLFATAGLTFIAARGAFQAASLGLAAFSTLFAALHPFPAAGELGFRLGFAAGQTFLAACQLGCATIILGRGGSVCRPGRCYQQRSDGKQAARQSEKRFRKHDVFSHCMEYLK